MLTARRQIADRQSAAVALRHYDSVRAPALGVRRFSTVHDSKYCGTANVEDAAFSVCAFETLVGWMRSLQDCSTKQQKQAQKITVKN